MKMNKPDCRDDDIYAVQPPGRVMMTFAEFLVKGITPGMKVRRTAAVTWQTFVTLCDRQGWQITTWDPLAITHK